MLIVIRGLPGSGKSTLGRKLAEAFSCAFIEPDIYCRSNLKYHYTPSEYELAVKKAKANVAMLNGCDVVYCDVLPLRADVEDIARCYGIAKPDCVITLHCSAEYSKLYNIHHVRPKDIDRFCEIWEEYKASQDFKMSASCDINDLVTKIFTWAIEQRNKAEMNRIGHGDQGERQGECKG